MKITEKNFIKQLNNGNERALEYVMLHYGGLVKSVVHRHLYSLTQYEEDCINEVFFAVWNHISSYQPEKSIFANWIGGIARLKALDALRKHSKEMWEERIDDQVVHIVDGTCEPSLELEELISEETEQLLCCLKEKDRELFYRLYVEEQSMDEVSEVMGMEKSVIYNRLSRAKRRVRKDMERKGNYEG